MAITPLISDPDGTSWPGLSRPSTAWLGWRFESWMPGSSPGMTGSGASVIRSQCAKQWKYDMVISRDWPPQNSHSLKVFSQCHTTLLLFFSCI